MQSTHKLCKPLFRLNTANRKETKRKRKQTSSPLKDSSKNLNHTYFVNITIMWPLIFPLPNCQVTEQPFATNSQTLLKAVW